MIKFNEKRIIESKPTEHLFCIGHLICDDNYKKLINNDEPL